MVLSNQARRETVGRSVARSGGLLLILAAMTASVCAAFAAGEDPPSFTGDVFPILVKKCSGCHFPDVELKSNFDLSTVETMLTTGDEGGNVIPGNADESRLVKMIEREIDPKMPPPKKFRKLKPREIKIIKAWIDAGAQSDEPVKALARAEKQIVRSNPSSEKPVDAGERAEAPPSRHPNPVGALAFSPAGDGLLARGSLHEVQLLELNAKTGELKWVAKLGGHADLVRALAFSTDGKRLAAAGGKPGRSGEVKVWDIPDRSLLLTIDGHRDNVLDVVFSPDGRLIATASYDKTVEIRDAATGEELHTLTDHVDPVYAVAFSPDGSRLATGAGDRTVRIYDPDEGKLLFTFSDSLAAVLTVAFSPSGRQLAAGAADKMIRVWDTEGSDKTFTQTSKTAGVLLHSTFAHDGPVLRILYSPDGGSIFSTSEDLTIKIWDAETMNEQIVFEPQSDWVTALALNPAGDRLAAGRYDSTTTVYETATGKPLRPSEGADDLAEDLPLQVEEKTEAQGRKKVTEALVQNVVIKATVPPSLGGVKPNRHHRGSDVEVTLEGKNLADAEPVVSDPAIKAEVIEIIAHDLPDLNKRDSKGTGVNIVDNGRPYTVKLKLTLPEDLKPGRQSIRLRTPLGITNDQGFVVTVRPDVGETEPNDEIDQAQWVQSPSIVMGSIGRSGDVDRFKLKAAQGQELVFVLTDSNLDAAMRLLDAAGQPLASLEDSGDASHRRLGFKFTADGDYILEIGDRNLRANIGYQLHIGEFPVVTRVFPLGVGAGEPAEVHVEGFNLGGASEIEVDPPADAKYGTTLTLPIPDYAENPIPKPRIAVGPYPEIAETEPNDAAEQAQAVSFPVTINGRIEPAGGEEEDADFFRFSAKRGESIVLEIEAARLGSPLDSVIDVLDAEGRVIERGAVRCEARTQMTLSGRNASGSGFRLDSWKDIAINDYLMIGSEVLRVNSLPDYPDEDVTVRTWPTGTRKGYFGTTPEFHAVDTPVYKVSIHPPGARFAPNGLPVFHLYWRNDDHEWEGASGLGDSMLEFIAPSDGKFIVRVRDVGGNGGLLFAYRLNLRRHAPDFDVVMDPYWPNISAGGRVPINVRVRRRDGFDGPVKVRFKGLPETMWADPATILAGHNSVTLALWAAPDAHSDPLGATHRIVAEARVKGEQVIRATAMGPITVSRERADLDVASDSPRLAIRPGQSGWMTVKLHRFHGFTSRVPINVRNLPFGARVVDTGLNGILVREHEDERPMEIYAEPWVPAMKRTIYIEARIESSPAPLFLSQAIEFEVIDPAASMDQEPAAATPVAEGGQADPTAPWDEEKVRNFIASIF